MKRILCLSRGFKECHINHIIISNQFYFRDHAFDSNSRKRLQGRKKEATVSTGRNDLQKGTHGIRWEKARSNESKILPAVKMGIDF